MATEPATLELLERDTELARLEQLLAAACAGNGGTVLVEGRPGIGKTSLLAALSARAEALGADVVSARGSELERHFAWGVVRRLFEGWLRAMPAGEREGVLDGAAGLALAVVDPAQAPQVPETRDATHQALHGLYWLVANAAARRPLVIVIDDAHWADDASVRFAAYLAERAGELPALLVIARRPAEPGAPPVLERLAGRADVPRVEPAPLGAGAVAALLGARLGREPDEAFAAECLRVTGGNPLLVQGVAAGLAADGVAPVAGAAPRVTALGSRAIGRTVAARLRALGHEAEAVAGALAVLGTGAPSGHVAQLAGLPGEEVEEVLDTLTACDIVGAARPLDFVHPLVRTAVHDGIPAARRARLHRRAAGLLAEHGAQADRLALHLLAAEPEHDPWVARTLADAARGALSRGATEAAVAQLRRALEEPPPAGERAGMLVDLGRAETQLGDPAGIGHLREALALAGDVRERAAVARELGLALVPPGRYEEAVEVLEAAYREAVAAGDRELALELLSGLLPASRLSKATTALALKLARELGEAPSDGSGAAVAVLSGLSMTRMLAGATADEAGAIAARALDGGILEHVTSDSQAFYDMPFVLIASERWNDARRACEAAVADARRRGSLLGFARSSAFQAILHLRAGRLAEAEADARASAELGLGHGWVVGQMAAGLLAEVLAERGRPGDARDALRAAGMDAAVPDTFMHNTALDARSRAHLASREPAAALADARELLVREPVWRAGAPAAFPLRSTAARALAVLGEPEQARELAAEEERLARAWGTPRAIGVALHARALGERGDAAIATLREAEDLLARGGAALEHARALAARGAALRRAGRRTDAQAALREALDGAARCGAGALEETVREELRALGLRPRRAALRGVDALTASERRVTTLVAQGMTNREAAQALFVTLRTVEVHLTSAYRKLGIASRTELPAALGEAQTLP